MEPVIWKGSPSALGESPLYAVAVAGAALLAPWAWPLSLLPLSGALWRFQHTRSIRYHLTNKRVRIRSGIFFKKKQSVKLANLRGYSLHSSRSARWFGLSSVLITTADPAAPQLKLEHLSDARNALLTIEALSIKRVLAEEHSPLLHYVDRGT